MKSLSTKQRKARDRGMRRTRRALQRLFTRNYARRVMASHPWVTGRKNLAEES